VRKNRTPPYNDEKTQTQLLTPEDEIIKKRIAEKDGHRKNYLKNRTPPYNDKKTQTQLLTPEDEIIKKGIAEKDAHRKNYLKNRKEKLGFRN